MLRCVFKSLLIALLKYILIKIKLICKKLVFDIKWNHFHKIVPYLKELIFSLEVLNGIYNILKLTIFQFYICMFTSSIFVKKIKIKILFVLPKLSGGALKGPSYYILSNILIILLYVLFFILIYYTIMNILKNKDIYVLKVVLIIIGTSIMVNTIYYSINIGISNYTILNSIFAIGNI